MLFHPDEDEYNQGQGHWMTRREYEYRRRKAYEQEQRRKAALLAEQERQAELRRYQQQAAERSRREREQYEKQQRAARASLQRQLAQEEEEAIRYPPRHTVVRGRDGRLYQVPVEDEDEPRYIRDIDGTIFKVPGEQVERRARRSEKSSSRRALRDSNIATSTKEGNDSAQTAKSHRKPKKSSLAEEDGVKTRKEQRRKKKKITVIVEDVSDDDSDIERDPLNDYWRNRHPSPEESWMEPVSL